MKKSIFNLLLVICLTSVHYSAVAQNSITIFDSETNLPIGEVLVTWKGGSIIGGVNGKISIPKGIQSVSLSRIGYQSKQLTFNRIHSGKFYLTPDNQLLEVQVTAYPLRPIGLTAPASYTAIPQEIIQLSNQVDFSNVLNNVPGLFMHNGTLGTNRITIRGIGARTPFGTNKIRAYFNEIPLTGGDGETSLEDNELSSIGNIEVIRGPSATSYGAGLAGLIKFAPVQIEKSSFSSSYGIGSYGLSRTNQSLKVAGDQHAIHGSFATTFSDSYRENNQYDRENFFLNYQFNGEKFQVDFLTTFIDVKSFIPSSLNETDFRQEPSLAAGNWAAVRGFEDYTKGLLGITVSTMIDEKQTIFGTLFSSFRDNYELRPFGILTEKSNLYGSRWKYTNNISRLVSIALGGEYSIENYEVTTFDQNDRSPGDLTSFNNQVRRNVNFYAESNWNLGTKWTVIGGLNFSKLSYDLTDLFRANGDQSGAYGFDAVLSPKIYIGHQISRNHQLYGQLSHGFSAPSVEETLTPDGEINPDIQPETGFSYEIGAKGRINESGISYQLNVYHMVVKNLLVARRTDFDQFVGINAGKTSHQGLEGEIRYHQTIGQITLSPFLNFSLNSIEFDEFQDLDEDFSGNKLPGVPGYNGSLGIVFKSAFGLFSNINYRTTGKMFLRDDNILENESYGLLNTKLGFQDTFGKFKLVISTGINNLLDKRYASQVLINAGSFGGRAPRYFYPGLPRNFFANLTVGYRL